MFSAAEVARRLACCEKPPVGIEMGPVEVGCLKDADGLLIGSISRIIIYNEDGSFKETMLEATMYADGSVVSPFTGAFSPCDDNQKVIRQDYLHNETCELHTLITCIVGEKVVSCLLLNPDKSLTKDPDMSDFKPAVADSNATQTVMLEAEMTVDYRPAADTANTVADILALGVLPSFTAPDGQIIAATADNICAYDVYAMECGAQYLTDPADLSTVTQVAVDSTFINGKGVRTKSDGAFAGAVLTDAVNAAADTVSCWCFQFKLAGEVAKDGTFTPAA